LLLLRCGKRTLSLALICHRRPERSFKFLGYQSLLCARCTGLLVGFLAFLGLTSIDFSIPLIEALLMMCPMLVDGFTQLFGLRKSNNSLRLITGVLYAVSFPFLLLKL
jgi:uncharacterized membrane protein